MQGVDFKEIIFVEGMKSIHEKNTTKERIMNLQNFKKVEENLPKDVHKSFFLAIEKIESVEKNRIKISDKLIPASDTYKDAFYKIFYNN